MLHDISGSGVLSDPPSIPALVIVPRYSETMTAEYRYWRDPPAGPSGSAARHCLQSLLDELPPVWVYLGSGDGIFAAPTTPRPEDTAVGSQRGIDTVSCSSITQSSFVAGWECLVNSLHGNIKCPYCDSSNEYRALPGDN